MPRGKNPALMDRDRLIFESFNAGGTLRAIGDEHGISYQRVSQIVAEYQGGLAEATNRGLHRARLESWLDEIDHEIHDGEPDPKISATGKTIEVDGQVVMDLNAHRKLKLDYMMGGVRILERLAKMDALDQPKKSEMPRDQARIAVDEWLAEVEGMARRAKAAQTIQGEVTLPEIESGQGDTD